MDIFDDTIDTSWLDEMLEDNKKQKPKKKAESKELKVTIDKS